MPRLRISTASLPSALRDRACNSLAIDSFRRTFYGTLSATRWNHGARKNTPKDRARILPQPYGRRTGPRMAKGFGVAERRAIGTDLLRAQWRWPIGMPLCRPMGQGLWEVRTDLPGNRTARVLICFYDDRLVALHGFIKKTRATPKNDLALARKRRKELEQ